MVTPEANVRRVSLQWLVIDHIITDQISKRIMMEGIQMMLS